jgi:hypothetical protein
LEYVGQPGHYKTAERLNEHFIDLRDVIAIEQKKGTDPLELLSITKFGFELIRNGRSHMDVRDLKKIMKEQEARDNLLEEIKKNKEIAHVTTPKAAVAKTQSSAQKSEDEPLPPANREAPAVQVFLDSREIAFAAEESNKPLRLLKNALTNLKGVNLGSLKANSTSAKELVAEIDKTLEKIKKAL